MSFVVCECNTLFWIALIIFGGLFGLLTLIVHEHKQDAIGHHPRKVIIYLKTAFPGAYMFMRSAGYFAGGYEDEFELAKVVAPSGVYYATTIMTVFAALFGAWIQLRYTHKEHCGCDDPDDVVDSNMEERKTLTTTTESKL